MRLRIALADKIEPRRVHLTPAGWMLHYFHQGGVAP